MPYVDFYNNHTLKSNLQHFNENNARGEEWTCKHEIHAVNN